MSDNAGCFGTLAGIAVMCVVSCRGCLVEDYEAPKAMERAGYSDIKVTSRGDVFVGFRGCEATDAAVFHVQAKNPAGKPVQMIVCSGWPFKGSTLRSP